MVFGNVVGSMKVEQFYKFKIKASHTNPGVEMRIIQNLNAF